MVGCESVKEIFISNFLVLMNIIKIILLLFMIIDVNFVMEDGDLMEICGLFLILMFCLF